jgi:hypothetical protein
MKLMKYPVETCQNPQLAARRTGVEITQHVCNLPYASFHMKSNFINKETKCKN